MTMVYTSVEEQIDYHLDTIDPDRTVEVNLRNLLFVYRTLQELVVFFHQPLHLPTLEAVERFMGSRELGAFKLISNCIYHKFPEMLPPDIDEQIQSGFFDHLNSPYYHATEDIVMGIGDPGALHYAVWKNDIDRMSALVDVGVPIDGRYNSITPLMHASSCRSMEAGRWLLERGADVDAVDKWGMTPLHWALRCCHTDQERCLEIVNILIAGGADINRLNTRGETPLMLAVAADFYAMIDILHS